MNELVIERVGGSHFHYSHTILHEWVGYRVGGSHFHYSHTILHEWVGYRESRGFLIFIIHIPFCRNWL